MWTVKPLMRDEKVSGLARRRRGVSARRRRGERFPADTPELVARPPGREFRYQLSTEVFEAIEGDRARATDGTRVRAMAQDLG